MLATRCIAAAAAARRPLRRRPHQHAGDDDEQGRGGHGRPRLRGADAARSARAQVRRQPIAVLRLASPEGGPRMLVLSSRRPLFRNNPDLRRAVNFVIDRQALGAAFGRHGVSLTDQILSPYAAGFRERGLPRARRRDEGAGARARPDAIREGGFYSGAVSFILAQTKLIQASLRQIGIEAEIKTFPHPVFLRKVSTPGEPFDIANSIGFVTGYPDHTLLNCMFHGRFIPPPSCNYFYSTHRATTASSTARNGCRTGPLPALRTPRRRARARRRARGPVHAPEHRRPRLEAGRLPSVRPAAVRLGDRLPQIRRDISSYGACTATQTAPAPTARPPAGRRP